MSFTAGFRLGGYEILSTLGAGGMGAVYRARDTKLNRDVALKVLLPEVAGDPERLARFRRESQVLASLAHPNIGAIHTLEEAGDVIALVLELVEGPTLADRIAQGPIPLAEALSIARQIAEALEAAHDRGIIHRDLKPANIKLRPDGTVKVLDFGLAKAAEPAAALSTDLSRSPTLSVHATQAGIILGTAAYMSPEQAAGKAVDRRTDLWSFGVVLLEMLTGRRPFDAETTAETMAGVMMLAVDFSGLPAETPPSIRRLLRRCLEKDRKRRFPDAAAARLEIDDASQAPAEPPAAAPLPALRPRATWRAGAMGAALLLAGIAIGAATMMMVRPGIPEPVLTNLDLANSMEGIRPSEFALSPDGRRLAFVAGADRSGRQLWVRHFDQPGSQPVPGTDGAFYPFWSPDSQSVGFGTDNSLKRVNLAGGVPQIVSELPPLGVFTGGAWNSDGVIVYSVTGRGLLRVPAAGGTPIEMTQRVSPQRGHGWPQFLPGGTHVLFLIVGPAGPGEPNTIATVPLAGGEPTTVAAAISPGAYALPGYLLRVTQGVLTAQRFDTTTSTLSGERVPLAQGVLESDSRFRSAFSVSTSGILAYRSGEENEPRQLTWTDRAGKVTGVIGPADPAAPTSFALSPDGTRVANARNLQDNYDIWLTDSVRDVSSRFTFDLAGDFSPVWSPDGQQVVFRSINRQGGGPSDLFIKPANGASDEKVLLATPQPKTPLDWSRDGRHLLYAVGGGQSDIWALPLAGDAKPFAYLQSTFSETQGQFSPDARWVVYTSNESGRDEVYVRAFPVAGGKWQVSTAGGSQPRWSPDGKELFYLGSEGSLMAAPAAATSDSMTIGAATKLFVPRLATGQGISLTGAGSRALYAVAPDGRFLLNAGLLQSTATPLSIVQNWELLLAPHRGAGR